MPAGIIEKDFLKEEIMGTGTNLRAEVVAELENLRDQAYAAGWLPSSEAFGTHLERFNEEFGVERLRSADGLDLLYLLHRRGSTDLRSMVYWLEYKNDSEFSGNDWFGGIGGGSALKFGMYHRQPGDSWMTGSPQRMRQMGVDEAIALARRQRDELVAGCEVLGWYAGSAPTDEKYMDIQASMEKAAPMLHDDGWAHKYWSLIHPQMLDYYHSPAYQRYHLYKLLQGTPQEDGILVDSQASRFTCSGRFVEAAQALQLSTAALCMLLNRRDGAYRRYWKVGTTAGSDGESNWKEMLENGVVSIGWKEDVEDLSDVIRQEDDRAKAEIRNMLLPATNTGAVATRKAGEVLNFAKRIQESDIVLACEGQRVRGIGRVIGPYEYDRNLYFPHIRRVEWLSVDDWSLPYNEGARTTVFPIGTYAPNLLELEARLATSSIRERSRAVLPQPSKTIRMPAVPLQEPVPALDKMSTRVEAILRRKGQVVLYGPPGTGKTLHAMNSARELAARHNFNRAYAQLDADQRRSCDGQYIRTCTFHPGWGYEHFIEGLRPSADNGPMAFVPKDGIFKTLCKDAAKDKERNYFLVIDEINRGDLPRIFGELITTIEHSKRNQIVTLPVTQDRFAIPENVFLIGTMNTADRSVSLMDTALRRRFGFIELMPNSALLAKLDVGGLRLGAWLDALNERLRRTLKRDARSMQIGHAYLMPPPASVADFARIVRDDVIPLLEEYCYDDFQTLGQILGTSIVDVEAACIREDLFEPQRERDLIQTLQFQEMQDHVLDQEPTLEAENEVSDEDVQDEPSET